MPEDGRQGLTDAELAENGIAPADASEDARTETEIDEARRRRAKRSSFYRWFFAVLFIVLAVGGTLTGIIVMAVNGLWPGWTATTHPGTTMTIDEYCAEVSDTLGLDLTVDYDGLADDDGLFRSYAWEDGGSVSSYYVYVYTDSDDCEPCTENIDGMTFEEKITSAAAISLKDGSPFFFYEDDYDDPQFLGATSEAVAESYSIGAYAPSGVAVYGYPTLLRLDRVSLGDSAYAMQVAAMRAGIEDITRYLKANGIYGG